MVMRVYILVSITCARFFLLVLSTTDLACRASVTRSVLVTLGEHATVKHMDP